MTTFGTVVVRHIRQEAVMKCPFYILVADHYNEDGICKCHNADYRKTMIRKWGYTKKDFRDAGIK